MTETTAQTTIGIMIFDGAEEMDFTGPWEVFSATCENMDNVRVMTVAPTRDMITCDKGMRVLPDAGYDDVAHLDVLIIPGGGGAWTEADNPATIAWLDQIAPGCDWLCSVCTGAFLLVAAGLASGRRVTTHHDFIDKLRQLDGAEIVEGVRVVRDGNLVTAGGVTSGIEMSLWLVSRMFGEDAFAYARNYIAYDYPPRSEIEDRA